MTVTADLDLDAVEADALGRIRELSEQMQRLAPEALTDEAVARELRTLESERLAAARAIEQAQAARAELGRRASEANAQSEAEARAAALERAEKLGGERLQAARAVDSALKKAAAAYKDLLRLTEEQSRELRAAGEPGLRSPSKLVMNGALVFALTSVGLNSHQTFEIDWQPPKALADVLSPPAPQEAPSARPTPRRVGQVPAAVGPLGSYRQLREVFGESIEVARAHALEQDGRPASDTSFDERFVHIEQQFEAA